MFVDTLTWYIGPPSIAFIMNVESILVFEDEVQSLLDMCLYDVCFLILIEPHTNQYIGVRLKK